MRVQNFLRPVAIPAVGGLLSAVMLFAGFFSDVALVRGTFQDDVPPRPRPLRTHRPSPDLTLRSVFIDTKRLTYGCAAALSADRAR
jgi:hypothetical protein